MGEARRRKIAGTYPDTKNSRADSIAWAMNELAARAAADSNVTGITLFPADGSEPLYLSAGVAKRPARWRM